MIKKNWLKIIIGSLIGSGILLGVVGIYYIILELFIKSLGVLAIVLYASVYFIFITWFVWRGPFFNVWMKKIAKKVDGLWLVGKS